MTTDRTIHDYVDGSLSSEEQAVLFSELASREDLRNELSSQLQLHYAVRKDHGAIVVPHDSTTAIFEKLGIPMPDVAGLTVAAESSVGADRRGAVLLLAVPLLFLATIALQHNATIALYRKTVMSKRSGGSIQQNVQPSPLTLTSDAKGPKRAPRSTSMQHLEVTPAQTLLSDSINLARQTPIGPNEELPASMMPVPQYDPKSVQPRRFDASIRSMARATSNPNPDLAAPNTMIPFAIGVHYRFDDEHAVGVDGGYEAFPQEYSRTQNGQTDVYRQAPSLWWVGATYRYSATGLRIADAITPIVSGTIAYTTVGPLIRSTIGVLVTPESRLSILLGLEGTALFYPIQSQFYSTRTLQLTYGISYRF